MSTRKFLLPLVCTGLLAVPLALRAQDSKPANDQVVDPQVDRREVRLPKFPSKDFEVGMFAGTYATTDFGAHPVVGLKLGYHITEDFFAEAVYARTKISDETFRLIFPGGGVFPTETVKLAYYNLSAGYNVLPGEVFIGRNTAKASQFYLIGGIGSTKVDVQNRQTVNLGFGLRVYFSDKAALQLDVRDHIFSLDLLGKLKSTQNLELTGGFTYFF
jgi:outer membrane beta-barrel protein